MDIYNNAYSEDIIETLAHIIHTVVFRFFRDYVSYIHDREYLANT